MPFKIDRNQPEIVREFRRRGAKVDVTATVGNGFPDLVVNYKSVFAIIEVKDGKGKRLRKVQKDWFADRNGLRFIVYDLEDIETILNIMDRVSNAAKEVLNDCCY